MPKPKTTTFDQALRLIHQHACDGSTIEQILDSVHISRQTLERHFQAHLGRTPGQELVRVRLEHAKTLLAMTHHPVKRIAQMVGFRQAANFSIFFRAQTGLSPTTFRQMNEEAANAQLPVAQARRSTVSEKRPIKLEARPDVATAFVF
jgi:transcriptional regulator GlxA family with amidase domain